MTANNAYHRNAYHRKIRFQIYLTARQRELLGEAAGKRGIAVAELVRRVLDEWIEEMEMERDVAGMEVAGMEWENGI